MTPRDWFGAYGACLASTLENLEAAKLMMADAGPECPDDDARAMLARHVLSTVRLIRLLSGDLRHVTANARMLAPMTDKDTMQ